MTRAGNASASFVEEIQGLYGAFSFPEKLLQKIWLRGDFNRAAALTVDGRCVRVLHPGKWNLLGGPDFLGARLRFDDGPAFTGDVEAHLHAADWEAHGHARDPAYDKVVLHVVLFPPDAARTTRGAAGREIPMVALLPLLHHSLEEFAAEEAVEKLAQRAIARLPDELGGLPAPEQVALLERQAEARWQQKVRFARLRVQRLGWEEACHHAALEVLGYRFNRAPMLRAAGRWSLEQWTSGAISPDEAYAAEAGGWSLQGVRPANRPHLRLRQYAAWNRARADWPARLVTLAAELPPVAAGATTRDVRRLHRLADLRERAMDAVCAGEVAGTRFDTLWCDGLLPLLAVPTGHGWPRGWFHWYAGDLPPWLTTGLRHLGLNDGREQPSCHGLAQGLLAWLLEQEGRNDASRDGATGRGA